MSRRLFGIMSFCVLAYAGVADAQQLRLATEGRCFGWGNWSHSLQGFKAVSIDQIDPRATSIRVARRDRSVVYEGRPQIGQTFRSPQDNWLSFEATTAQGTNGPNGSLVCYRFVD